MVAEGCWGERHKSFLDQPNSLKSWLRLQMMMKSEHPLQTILLCASWTLNPRQIREPRRLVLQLLTFLRLSSSSQRAWWRITDQWHWDLSVLRVQMALSLDTQVETDKSSKMSIWTDEKDKGSKMNIRMKRMMNIKVQKWRFEQIRW